MDRNVNTQFEQLPLIAYGSHSHFDSAAAITQHSDQINDSAYSSTLASTSVISTHTPSLDGPATSANRW